MKSKKYTFEMGLKMFLVIGAFFILAYLLKLGQFTELRFLNVFIVIYFTSRLAKKNLIEDDKLGYVENLASLFAANAFNVFLSIIGFSLFINFVDPNYINEFGKGFFWGNDPNIIQVCLALFLEGMAGSAIVSFGVMQYWKNYKRVHKKVL